MSVSGNPTIVVNRPTPNNDVPTTTTSGVQLSIAPVNDVQCIAKFVNMPVTLTRTSGSIASGSATVMTFPAGLDIIDGAVLRITSIAADGASLTAANLVVSVGTVAADTANGTLTSTEANIVPSTAAAMAASAVGVVEARTTTVPGLLNGTSSANVVRLNFATSDDITSTRTLTVNGYLLVTARSLGNSAVNL